MFKFCAIVTNYKNKKVKVKIIQSTAVNTKLV